MASPPLLLAVLLLALCLRQSGGKTYINGGPPATTLATMEFHWRSYHRGELCSSEPYAYVVEPAPINRCYPPDPMSAAPHLYSCSNPGTYQFNLIRTIYAPTDKNCAGVPIETNNIKRDRACKKDIEGGHFHLTHCGKLSPEVSNKDTIFVKSYSNEACTWSRSIYGAGIVKATLLGMCMPSFYDPQGPDRDVIRYNRRLVLVNADTVLNVVTLQEHRYDKDDIDCSKGPVYSTLVTYDAGTGGTPPATPGGSPRPPPCKQDPLYSGSQSYTHFAFVRETALASWSPPDWFFYPGPY